MLSCGGSSIRDLGGIFYIVSVLLVLINVCHYCLFVCLFVCLPDFVGNIPNDHSSRSIITNRFKRPTRTV